MIAPLATSGPSATGQPAARHLVGRLHASWLAVANRLSTFRPFGLRAPETAMQFAERGKLTCLCSPLRLKRPGPERRQTCRTCGLPTRYLSRNVDRQLTTAEIQAIERNLRIAAVKCATLEVPTSISTLRQLNNYLASNGTKLPRVPSEEIGPTLPSEAN